MTSVFKARVGISGGLHCKALRIRALSVSRVIRVLLGLKKKVGEF